MIQKKIVTSGTLLSIRRPWNTPAAALRGGGHGGQPANAPLNDS